MFGKKKNKETFIFDGHDEKREMFIKNDYISEEELWRMKNPFFYTHSIEGMSATSIEDFGIVFRKKNVSIQSIVRNPYIKSKKKIKIIKKYFKKNRKEFLKYQKELQEKSNGNEKSIAEVDFSKNSKKFKIILFIMFLLSSFWFLFGVYPFKEVISGFMESIIAFKDNEIFAVVGAFICTVMTVIWTFTLIGSKCKYKNLKKHYKKDINKSFRILKKKFYKDYNKVLKYYINNIKKNSYEFKSLGFEILWNSTRTNETILNEIDNTTSIIEKIKVFQKKYVIGKCIFNVLAIVLNIIVIVIVINKGIKLI